MKLSEAYFIGVTLSIVCLLPQSLAAPAAVGDNNEDSRDKRSGEVIFFENSKKAENSLKKRSDDWPMLGSSAKHEEESKSDDFTKSLSDDLKEKNEKEVLAELEKWAFDEALDFLVDKLIAEAYKEELDEDYYEYDDTTSIVVDQPIVEHATQSTPTAAESQEEFDDEADALAALIAKQNHKLAQQKISQHEADVETRADDSYDIDIKPAVDVDDETSSEEKFSDDQLSMEMADDSSQQSEGSEEESEEEYEDSGEDTYSIENILEYFEYLNKLKGMEDFFKNGGKNLEKDEKHEDSSKSQVRKKRSIPEDWVDSRMSGGQGVCFTADEARELKDLLLGLAKDRVVLQELSSYLTDEEAAGLAIDSGYPNRNDDGRKQLENLAFRLNQQQRSVYRQQMPQSKRPYEFSPYDFEPRN